MHPKLPTLLLLLTVASAGASTSHALAPHNHGGNSAETVASCLPREREALLAFKQGITGDPAGRLASWNQSSVDDCCRWTGVRCSNLTSHVLEIQLGNAHDDDPEFNLVDTALIGQISSSLLSLHYLESLDLSLNNLSGPTGRVPEFLGLLTNLAYLNLSGMPLSGRVPPQLGNLSKLTFLDLSPSSYVAPWGYQTLYSNDISWLSNLPLQYLNMDSVNLSMVVDWAHVVNMVPTLKVLRLPECSLTSANQSLPQLNLTGLEELILSGNYFSNPAGSCWFWNLTNLLLLELSGIHLYGQFPESLGDMSSLQTLVFAGNDGSIDITTANLRNLCSLESLDLSYNDFNNHIIESLPQCSPNKLKELYLGCNNFTGLLPGWIGHQWSSLLILELSGNRFTGDVPSEIGMLNKLLTLDLSKNQFSGPVPSEIGMLKNLLVLHLSGNRFNGPVPSEIGMLNKLIEMDLSNNNLTGVITHDNLAGLANLTTIDLSGNYLKIMVDPKWLPPFRLQLANFATCDMGPLFPVWLQRQEHIVELYMSRASILGKLPDWFFTAYSNAQILDISSNAICGTLPKGLENMTLLVNLYLNSNQLTGPVPRLPINLYDFDISENSFSGPLSSDFGSQNLEYLNLASNHFTGPIPHSICGMTNLGLLNLANNYFDGEFPLCTEPAGYIILILRNNKLSGKFPSSLKIWTGLHILDLAWNKFNGRLPMWIGDLTELRILHLSQNMFTGRIPATITRLSQLSQLNLAGNMLSGPLPRYLSNLTGMTKAYVPTFGTFAYPRASALIRRDRIGPMKLGELFVIAHVNLSVITKGQERYYMDGELYAMVSVDLSSNKLSGVIPEEITSLDEIINLNLSWNQFSGKIPSKIGDMQSLESLDLKENKLYGEIPGSLTNITYLSYLDLSHNSLTGRIPSGGQLDTLYQQYPSMYNGNSGLCGPPLQNNCFNNSEPVHGDHRRDEYDSKLLSFSFGLGAGYVVGLWVVFCVFLFKKSWMVAYFGLFDVAFDKIYVFVVLTCARCAKETTTY